MTKFQQSYKFIRATYIPPGHNDFYEQRRYHTNREPYITKYSAKEINLPEHLQPHPLGAYNI